MWKKSQFGSNAYQKVDEEEKDSRENYSFNYQKMKNESKEEVTKNQKTSSHSTSSSSSAYSSQQTYLIPPVFPIVPQRFAFLG